MLSISHISSTARVFIFCRIGHFRKSRRVAWWPLPPHFQPRRAREHVLAASHVSSRRNCTRRALEKLAVRNGFWHWRPVSTTLISIVYFGVYNGPWKCRSAISIGFLNDSEGGVRSRFSFVPAQETRYYTLHLRKMLINYRHKRYEACRQFT